MGEFCSLIKDRAMHESPAIGGFAREFFNVWDSLDLDTIMFIRGTLIQKCGQDMPMFHIHEILAQIPHFYASERS